VSGANTVRAPAELWRAGLGTFRAGRLEEAEASFRALLAVEPDHAPSHHLLGVIAFARGRSADALSSLARATALDPHLAQAQNDLGAVLQLEGRNEEALAAYRRALTLEPRHPMFHFNLGSALQASGALAAAIAAYRAALALEPRYSAARVNLGNALLDQGRLEEARTTYRAARDGEPENADAHSNLLRALHYDESLAPDAMLAAHRGWNAAHGSNAPPSPHGNAAEPGRRLRVGFVSPDFRTHSVAYFFEPLLAAIDRGAVESFCYANVMRPDAVTARLASLADHWIPIFGVPDAAVAERVRADGIDILVDLAGHTAGHRLGLFALKPAPVEATWCGYCDTTGLDAIDWRLTDAVADPEGAERWTAERLMRLPHGFLCYAPDPAAPAVASLPARKAGHVTFGSFNALPKLSPATIRPWAQILIAVPDARLFLKAPQLRDSGARDLLLSRFETLGVAPDRIELAPSIASAREHLALYGRVDIALDPFPYNGTATSCEALWMGVPVIALRGRVHAARVGASLLTQIGLEELIASTPEEYIARAVSLARDLDWLERLRQGLRARLNASPLMDRAGFARDMEAALRAMWREWCGRQTH
jgi:predicted O-linked N-acetylglucosamine transferase (SPINDLY family)